MRLDGLALKPGQTFLLVNQCKAKENGVYMVKRVKAKPRVKVWITKYALTTGVYTAMVELDPRTPKLAVEHTGGVPSMICYYKPHWWLTDAEARKRFKELLDKERQRVARQQQRLVTLRYSERDTNRAK